MHSGLTLQQDDKGCINQMPFPMLAAGQAEPSSEQRGSRGAGDAEVLSKERRAGARMGHWRYLGSASPGYAGISVL